MIYFDDADEPPARRRASTQVMVDDGWLFVGSTDFNPHLDATFAGEKQAGAILYPQATAGAAPRGRPRSSPEAAERADAPAGRAVRDAAARAVAPPPARRRRQRVTAASAAAGTCRRRPYAPAATSPGDRRSRQPRRLARRRAAVPGDPRGRPVQCRRRTTITPSSCNRPARRRRRSRRSGGRSISIAASRSPTTSSALLARTPATLPPAPGPSATRSIALGRHARRPADQPVRPDHGADLRELATQQLELLEQTMSRDRKRFDWQAIHAELERRLSHLGRDGRRRRRARARAAAGSAASRWPRCRATATPPARLHSRSSSSGSAGNATASSRLHPRGHRPCRTARPCPAPAPGILGIVAWRGEFVVVFDLAPMLGLPRRAPRPTTRRIIVLRGEEPRIALAVDAVDGIVQVEPSALQPPDRTSGAARRSVQGRHAGRSDGFCGGATFSRG